MKTFVQCGFLLLLMAFGQVSTAGAITAEEKLSNPVLETRARALSQQLRCLVCQNQSIDDSDAPLAQDLRRIVRELLVDGRSDTEILDYLQETYGDYVLLNPPHAAYTLVLWYAPVGIVLFAILLLVYSRRNRVKKPPAPPEPQSSLEEPPANPPRTSFLLGIMVIVVLSFAYAAYQFLGRPDLAPQPIAERAAEIASRQSAQETEKAEMQAARQSAKNQTLLQPKDVEAWTRLAIAASALGHFPEAIHALQTALNIAPSPLLRLHLAEVLVQAADGQVTLEARALLDTVLETQPQHPFALYMQGLAQYQDERYAIAVDTWQEALQFSTPDAPWRPAIAQLINSAAEIGGFPVPENTNTVTEVDIAGMVARLAQRLQEDPNNAEGWRRLGRAYDVLGRLEEAENAYYQASIHAADQAVPSLQYLEWLLARGLSTKYLTHANAAIARIKDVPEHQSEYLFFAGHLAKLRGDSEAMATHWQELLKHLPEDSPVTDSLRQQLQAGVAN